MTLSPSLLLVDWIKSLPSATLDTFADTDPNWGRLIFRDGLPLKIAATGKRSLTITASPGGTNPAPGSRVYGSTAQIRFYADHTRDANGLAPVEDGTDRAWVAWGKADYHLADAKARWHAPRAATIQLHRTSPPLESFDQQQDLPYVVAVYDLAIITDS